MADLTGAVEDEMVLEPGMVVVLQPYVWEGGVGGVLGKETLLVTSDGPERLSNFPHGPLGG